MTKGEQAQGCLFIVAVLAIGYFAFNWMFGSDIPSDWYGKKLYQISDNRNWIQFNDDGTFTLHEESSTHGTHEWAGTLNGMTLECEKPLSYNTVDGHSTVFNPEIEFQEIYGQNIRIVVEGFSNIRGYSDKNNRQIWNRDYTPTGEFYNP